MPKLQNIHLRQFFYIITLIGELFSLNLTSSSFLFCYTLPFSLQDYNLYPDLDWSFREHLAHALPTEMIFNLLGSIRTGCLIHDYSTDLMFDTLDIIIKWLQVSVSEFKLRRLKI